jgi:hypothetical protein
MKPIVKIWLFSPGTCQSPRSGAPSLIRWCRHFHSNIDLLEKAVSQYAARLSVLPHCVTRQVSFVLQCQLAQSGKQFPGLKLELPQLPQTRKNQFGWPFHKSAYGRFSVPRCDVKHWPPRPARSVSSEGDVEANPLLFLRDITRIGVRWCVVSLARRRSRNTAIGFKFASFNGFARARLAPLLVKAGSRGFC